MSLWWLGNVLLIAVIVPVVLLLLTRVLIAAFRVRKRLAGLAEQGPTGGEGGGLQELEKTRQLVAEVRTGLRRHADVLSELAARR